MYDIASLTKVVVTTTLVEKLVEGDFPSPLNLDAPIERYLPEWTKVSAIGMAAQSDRAQLMTHTSGLPPFRNTGGHQRASKRRWGGFLPSRWNMSQERKLCTRILGSF